MIKGKKISEREEIKEEPEPVTESGSPNQQADINAKHKSSQKRMVFP